MSVTRQVKAVAYAVAAALLMGFCAWTVAPLYSSGDLVAAYLRSDILQFLMACGVTGVGVYSFFAYTKRHREHRRESWFLMVVGLLLLALTVVVFLRWGGMSEEYFSADDYVPINFNLMLAGAVPLPFLVRAGMLAAGCTGRNARLVAWGATAVALILYVVLIATGCLWRTVSA